MKIAFDVDGTLIHQSGMLCDSPRYEIIQLYKIFESLGHDLYIWSGGGVYYAARWAEKLGLTSAKIIAKGSIKVDLAIDDVATEFENILATLVLRV